MSLLFLQGCENPGLIGLEDQQFQNGLITDTSTVRAQTIPVEKFRTDNNVVLSDRTGFYSLINYRPVGYFKDPVFGSTDARSFTQAFSTGGDFGTGPVLDSAVLILRYPPLAYRGIYGDTLNRVNIVVEELTETIVDTAEYLTDKLFSTGQIIASQELTINRKDSVWLQDIIKGKPDTLVKVAPHLRIKLDNGFISSRLLNIDTAILNDQKEFLNYFKGVALSMDSTVLSSNGALMSFNMASENASEIRLYYRTNANADTLSKSFPLNSAAGQSTYLQHDYSNTEVFNGGDSLLYIQALQGLQTSIGFPYLRNLADSGIVSINKAELILTVSPGSSTAYHPVPQLFLHHGLGDNGLIRHLIDTYTNPTVATLFSGVYQQNNGSYRFNITRFVQAALDGHVESDSLYLGALNSIIMDRQVLGSIQSASQPSRVILGGPTHPNYKARLEIVYSK